MAAVVVTVHAAAAACEKQWGNPPRQVKAPIDSIAAAKEELSRRFAISGEEAGALLGRMAAHRGISVSRLADQLMN
jgi:hypothetical protein